MIDDHEGFRLRMRRLLEREGYRVVEGVDGADGIRRAVGERPDLILLDVNLPDASGFDVATRLHSGGATAPIILISTHPATDLADSIRRSGAAGFIDKADLSAPAIAAFLGSPS
ncbi:MAG TPA: response regulator [Candidatus Limnocylindrales bacterium]